MLELEAKKELWRKHGMDDHEMVDKAGMHKHVQSDVYLGGMIDHSGGHMHPLNLALGEAAAFEVYGRRHLRAFSGRFRVTGCKSERDDP